MDSNADAHGDGHKPSGLGIKRKQLPLSLSQVSFPRVYTGIQISFSYQFALVVVNLILDDIPLDTNRTTLPGLTTLSKFLSSLGPLGVSVPWPITDLSRSVIALLCSLVSFVAQKSPLRLSGNPFGQLSDCQKKSFTSQE